MNRRSSVLALSILPVLSLALFGQDRPLTPSAAPPLRKWSDVSGKFSLDARLVEVLDREVILERENGTRIKVPIARLNQADQAFVLAQDNPFAEDVRDSVKHAAVVVWPGAVDQSHPVPGYVYKIDGKTAFVVVESAWLTQADFARGFEVAIRAKDGSILGLPATPTTPYDGRSPYFALRVDSSKITHSLASMKKAEIRDSAQVKLVGHQFRKDGLRTEVTPVTAGATVTTVFRNSAGVISRVQVSLEEAMSNFHAIVVDANGAIVGLTRRETGAPRNLATIELTTPFVLESRTRPFWISATPKVVAKQGESCRVDVEGQYFDILRQASNVRVFLYQPTTTPTPTVGRYSEDAYEVKLANPSMAQPGSFTGTAIIPVEKLRDSRLAAQLMWSDAGGEQYSSPGSFPLTSLSNIEISGIRPDNDQFNSQLVPAGDAATKAMADAKKWVESEAPRPVTSDRILAGPEVDLKGAKGLPLNLGELAGRPVWSPDGKFLYFATVEGGVSRVSFPGFLETHRLDTMSAASSISYCKTGVVVVLKSVGEVLVLDSANLAVTRKIELRGGMTVSGSPISDQVYVSTVNSKLVVIDTREGRVVSSTDGNAGGQALLTPDGRYVFTKFRDTIRRYRVKGSVVEFEEASGGLGTSPNSLCVCADSKHVALMCGAGNGGAYREFGNLGYGTFLFPVEDLKRPRIGITTEAYPRAIDVDPKTGMIYAQNREFVLLVFAPRGARSGQYGYSGNETLSLLPHPGGGSVLAQFEAGAMWIQVPASSPEKGGTESGKE